MGRLRAWILVGCTDIHTKPLDKGQEEEGVKRMNASVNTVLRNRASPAPLDQPSHLLRCDLIRSNDQISLILSIFIVEDNDESTLTNLFDGFVYRGEVLLLSAIDGM